MLAIGLGLLGFVEPCSIGANMVFLGHLREKGKDTRLRETAKFAVVRAVVLGSFGLGIAFLGSFVFAAQKGFWLVLGLLYLALGVAVILNARFRWGLFGRVSLRRLLPERGGRSLGLGLLFGLNLPACAYPLMLALLGPGAVLGALVGFFTLFVFGLAEREVGGGQRRVYRRPAAGDRRASSAVLRARGRRDLVRLAAPGHVP